MKNRFITNHVVETIDAIGISDDQAARLLSAVAQSLGFKLDDLVVSRATIRRRREENQEKVVDTLKENFKVYKKKEVKID